MICVQYRHGSSTDIQDSTAMVEGWATHAAVYTLPPVPWQSLKNEDVNIYNMYEHADIRIGHAR